MTKLPYIFGAILLISTTTASAHIEKGPPSCDVVKVEGKGSAKVRRKSGVMQVATEAMQVYAGDRVITDSETVVSLFFADGSIMKVGINSEYLLKEAEEKNRVIQYVFDLFKGSVKAMVENFSAKQPARYRLSTPEGTIGIRGTEFTLEHDPATNVTRLDLTEGSVMAGPVGCHTNNSCSKLQAPTRTEFKAKKMIPVKITQTPSSAGAAGEAPAAETQEVQGAKAVLESKSSTANEMAAQNKKLEELQAELLGISMDSLKKLKAESAERLSQFREGAGRYRDAMGVTSPDGSEFEGRTLALGEALSRQEGFNKGKLSKKLLKNAPADETVQEYTAFGKNEQAEGGPRSNWRAALSSQKEDDNAPSAAIQAQQKASKKKEQEAKASKVKMTNRGGLIVNESTMSPETKPLAISEEKPVTTVQVQPKESPKAPAASPPTQKETTQTASNKTVASPTPNDLINSALSNSPTGTMGTPTGAPGHSHCHYHKGSSTQTCEWHVIGVGHHD